MLYVKVILNGIVDESQPGWVECSLIDAQGEEWLFVEKVPVVSNLELDANSDFPQQGYIACTFLSEHSGEDGSHLVMISTEEPSGIQSTTGQYQFEVHAGQLIQTE